MKLDEAEVAKLVILGMSEMTKAQRRKVAQWLRSRAKVVEKFGDIQQEYARRFTQRLYLIPAKRSRAKAKRA